MTGAVPWPPDQHAPRQLERPAETQLVSGSGFVVTLSVNSQLSASPALHLLRPLRWQAMATRLCSVLPPPVQVIAGRDGAGMETRQQCPAIISKAPVEGL